MVATLVRCCDVSSLTQPYGGAEGAGPSALPNPYLEPALQGEPLMPLQPQVADLLFNRYVLGKLLVYHLINQFRPGMAT